MKEITIKSSFWVLHTEKGYIAPTHSDWGPDYLPHPDIVRAKTFTSPIEAMEFTYKPGQGWEDAKPIQVDTITKYTYSEP